ncbi:NAD-dependent epimerase/dehydratase family protein [Micromonospora endolithica]|uniref:NAD-dependent epimerase/dehydratase family protein n=1 Tax=Micromonospora endolithica TaxID=230091 RepID=A0A3A9ZJI1_9ACTN|nr:NAD-dependent epimerase/dehydratase family protein [Micromonospora endolithica]RKN47496.1 NAD-dependent epimerase/dehydratase family protein [Micromonospora endolithica]TWJ21131.1 nucleoside-diphosphate-sugar epimerase [Micromonospora endolithica]
MDVVGRGFVAQNLLPIADRHPRVTVLAAGVSTTVEDDAAEFQRETELVRRQADRCRREGRMLIFLSTASHSMYGSPPVAADEDYPVTPPEPYGRHKLALERELRAHGVDWLTLRLSHAVGPGQRGHQLLTSLMDQIRAGSVQLFQGNHRDLVDVRDVVAALDGLLAADVRNEVVNVASGTAYPIEDIIDGVEARLGCRAAREIIVDVDPNHTVVSVAKLRALAPAACPSGGPRYLDHLLDRYVGPSPVSWSERRQYVS